MLTQKTNSSKSRYNKWIAVPLFIATAIFFVISCQKKNAFNEQANDTLTTRSSQKAAKGPGIDARYPGDWGRFLQTNLRGDVPVENGAGPGNYQVIAQFMVDVDGTVSDVTLIKDPGYGMGAEAVRVIKQSGKWEPAITDGKKVKAHRKQPITFQVTEG